MQRFRHGFGKGFWRRGRRLSGSDVRRRLEAALGRGDGQLTLVQMRAGESGRVVEITAGEGMSRRLSALGIRPGLKVTKVGSMLMRGPVTVRVGSTQLAIGYGMASRIVVEPTDGTRDGPERGA